MKQYIYNIVLCLSQLVSVLLGGHPDVSLSQRTGAAYLYYSKKGGSGYHWFKFQRWLIDSIFWNWLWQIERNHCLNSLEGEPNAQEVWSWIK